MAKSRLKAIDSSEGRWNDSQPGLEWVEYVVEGGDLDGNTFIVYEDETLVNALSRYGIRIDKENNFIRIEN